MAKKSKKKPGKKTVKKSVKKSAKKKVFKKAKRKAPKKALKKPAAQAVKKSTTINVYLNFNGNCEDAFGFYKSVFGGDFAYVGRYKDMPPAEGNPIPESEAQKIMHISLPVSQETVLMGSDSSDAFGHATNPGNNFSISINAMSQAEADRLFQSLSEGGKINMPLGDMFWGAYFGMLTDKFGINWMVNFDRNPVN